MQTLIPFLAVALYLVFLSFQPALAGAPPLQWQKTFGGSYEEQATSVQQTTDGGYIIAGIAWGDFFPEDADVYLIKTDPNGDELWHMTFGGDVYDTGRSVEQTSDGGYIIAGRTGTHGPGYCDVYLIKTEPNGNSQWQKTFGGSDWEDGWSVQQTTDGGYIITGSTSSYGEGNGDVYLIKTDPNGDMLWQKTFGTGDNYEYGRSVQQTSDGGYIIAGYTGPIYDSNSNVYLVKTDPCGNTEWESDFGGAGRDEAYSVQQTSDGGYIITGSTRSYGAGLWDVYLIKTDSSGNMQWQKTFGESNRDLGRSVLQSYDGGYIIAGSTYSFGAGHWDVYFIKTDPSGNSQWQKTFGGKSGADGYSVQQTSDGGYIIAGLTESYGAGNWDVYLIKLCPDGTLSADFNCNGTVNFEDLDIMVGQWLQPPDILSADIAPEPGDGIVNFLDFAVFGNDWLQSTIP